jgi:hypothetical protein
VRVRGNVWAARGVVAGLFYSARGAKEHGCAGDWVAPTGMIKIDGLAARCVPQWASERTIFREVARLQRDMGAAIIGRLAEPPQRAGAVPRGSGPARREVVSWRRSAERWAGRRSPGGVSRPGYTKDSRGQAGSRVGSSGRETRRG